MQNTPNFDQDQDKLCHKNLCNILKVSFDQDEEEILISLKEKIEPLSKDDLARIINMEDKESTTLLHHAVNKDKPTVIEYLLNKGAKSDIKNNICTRTAYDVAINFARTDDVRNLMDGNTPIHKCAIKGNIEGIKRILVESASNSNFSIIDAKNRKGNTPLQLACKKGDLQIAKHLINKGADSTVIDREGNNLLHLLSRSGISDTAFFYSLVRNGVNPNLKNNLGDTPLHHLLRGNEPNRLAIISLINMGANINAIDRDGETPLLISLKKPQNEFYKLLLQIGANPNFSSSKLPNQTPLERLVINLTYNSNAQNFHGAVNREISYFMRFGLKLTPEFKKELDVQDKISNSKLQPEEARQDSKIKLITSLAQIINSKLKKDLSPYRPHELLSFHNAIGILAGDPTLGESPSKSLKKLALEVLSDELMPSRSDRPAYSALGGSAYSALGGSASRALGGSASSKRPNEGPAQNLNAEKKPRGSR